MNRIYRSDHAANPELSSDAFCPRGNVERRIRHLRGLLRLRGRSRADADDLIQEAFLRLHLYCQTEEVQQPEAFLARTVLNLSIDQHRKERRDLYSDESLETLTIADTRLPPDEEVAVRQRLVSAESVLKELPLRTREAFLMHRVEGYTCAQIAAHVGISPSAVEKHIARAVFALMEVVEKR